jgi:hypothetical protein
VYFLSKQYMTSQHQIEDPKESWLFTSEIAKGVFTELNKIQVVAADRTSASHNRRDAAINKPLGGTANPVPHG